MRLDQLTDLDLDWLAVALETWTGTQRWSLRGRTSSPAIMRTLLYDHVHLQRVIRRDDGVPVAIVQLVDVESTNGYGHIALLVEPRQVAQVSEPVAVFVDEAFRETGLRKLCVLAHEDGLDVSTVFATTATQVGRLDRHERRSENTYVDMLLFEVWPEVE